MEIPVILQGDDSGSMTLTLADGHNYEGATLVVVFNGVSRQYTNLTAGGSVVLAFTADETAGMPLGTALVNMRLVGANGGVETVGNANARIKVTDCVAEVNAGGSFAVTPGGNPLAGVEGLGKHYTGDQVWAKINEVIAKFGGKVAALALALLPCLGGVTVQTAPLGGIYSDEPVVTNVTVDVSDKADKADTYTKAEVDARIVELAPTPGNYANVSNRAMSAIQEHQSLWPAVAASTNYTDAALGAFASTGAVARATVYGTPTRWTDATGCVWEVNSRWVCTDPGAKWTYTIDGETYTHAQMIERAGGEEYSQALIWSNENFETIDGGRQFEGWFVMDGSGTAPVGYDFSTDTIPDYASDLLLAHVTYYGNITATRGSLMTVTNLVTRVAYTNDIPDVSGYATPADVTAAIREHSLCGIWDDKLGVWWTPHMSGGAYYWTATTNVNLSAEGN